MLPFPKLEQQYPEPIHITWKEKEKRGSPSYLPNISPLTLVMVCIAGRPRLRLVSRSYLLTKDVGQSTFRCPTRPFKANLLRICVRHTHTVMVNHSAMVMCLLYGITI
jgi:hypothetical protein